MNEKVGEPAVSGGFPTGGRIVELLEGETANLVRGRRVLLEAIPMDFQSTGIRGLLWRYDS